MTDIVGNLKELFNQEVIYLSSQGERLLFKIGENINALIDQFGNIAIIGEIKTSILSEEQFRSRRGIGWVLMKGQDITGSDFANITGINILPNCSGMFPRVSDPAATRDPDGATRNVLSVQDKAIKSHNHTVTRERQSVSTSPRLKDSTTRTYMWNPTGSNTIVFPGGVAFPRSGGVSFERGLTSSDGESGVPENISVNYFIRINI
jgi:hypothetical protein